MYEMHVYPEGMCKIQPEGTCIHAHVGLNVYL